MQGIVNHCWQCRKQINPESSVCAFCGDHHPLVHPEIKRFLETDFPGEAIHDFEHSNAKLEGVGVKIYYGKPLLLLALIFAVASYWIPSCLFAAKITGVLGITLFLFSFFTETRKKFSVSFGGPKLDWSSNDDQYWWQIRKFFIEPGSDISVTHKNEQEAASPSSRFFRKYAWKLAFLVGIALTGWSFWNGRSKAAKDAIAEQKRQIESAIGVVEKSPLVADHASAENTISGDDPGSNKLGPPTHSLHDEYNKADEGSESSARRTPAGDPQTNPSPLPETSLSPSPNQPPPTQPKPNSNKQKNRRHRRPAPQASAGEVDLAEYLVMPPESESWYRRESNNRGEHMRLQSTLALNRETWITEREDFGNAYRAIDRKLFKRVLPDGLPIEVTRFARFGTEQSDHSKVGNQVIAYRAPWGELPACLEYTEIDPITANTSKSTYCKGHGLVFREIHTRGGNFETSLRLSARLLTHHRFGWISETAQISESSLLAECKDKRAEACQELGRHFEQSGNFTSAREHYESACRGNFALACLDLAYLEYRLGNLPEAIHLAELACEKKYAEACRYAGLYAIGIKRYEQGHKNLRFSCLGLDPLGCSFHADIATKQGKSDEADIAFAQACALGITKDCDMISAPDGRDLASE